MKNLVIGLFSTILLTCCLIAILGVYKGYKLIRIAESARSIQTSLEESTTGTDISTIDIEETGRLIKEARKEAVAFQKEVEPLLFLAPMLNWAPEVGPLMDDAAHYMTLAEASTEISGVLAGEIETGIKIVQDGSVTDEKPIPQLLQLLQATEPKFDSIEDDLAQLQSSYHSLENKEDLPHQARRFIPELNRFMPVADEMFTFVRTLPDFFAVDGTRTYLIVVQNEPDLHATSGTVRDIGKITFANGEIQEINFGSGIVGNQGESTPEAKRNFLSLLDLSELAFQSNGLKSDYAISAETLFNLHALNYPNNAPLAGVITIDATLMEMLVHGVGDLSIGNYGVIYSSDIKPLLSQAQSARNSELTTNDWRLQHDTVMETLSGAIADRVENEFESLKLQHIGAIMLQAVERQNIQIWLTESHEQALVQSIIQTESNVVLE